MIIARHAALGALLAALVATTTAAATMRDPVKVDPKHYKIVYENARVRVLHIHYGPHETSVPHWHPDGVVTYVTDAHTKFRLANGKSIEARGKAGDALWSPAGTHTPTNLSDQPMDAVLVELKGK